VDDNATNRQILRQQLAGWDMTSDEVDGGQQALERLRAAVTAGTPYDLAILDYQMPDLDGLAVARAIRAEPALAALRLVLLTSVGDDGHVAEARAIGIAASLTKPVRQSQLYDCLANVMGDARTELVALTAPARVGGGPRLVGAPAPAEDAPRLLVVEDNFVNQKVAVYLLEARGYRVVVAGKGQEALEAIARAPYALVLMDGQVPTLDGFGATNAIRAREGTARHTPIIAMTAGAMAGEREKCLAAGMDDYITKPVTGEVLDRALQRWVQGQHRPVGASPAAAGDAVNGVEAAGETVVARLRSLAGGDPGFVSKFVNLFVEEMAAQLHTLETAVADGDVDAARRIVHGLRGACSNFGAERMEAIAAVLEERARAGTLADAAADVQALTEENQRLRGVLTQAAAASPGE
jgi:CheY-like chemotaxis protein/HPt (histidine-containing phosphotransfer) domain-containing protein